MTAIRAQSRTVERLDVGGAVVGLSRHSVYSHRAVGVRPGDLVIASTDGVCSRNGASGMWRDVSGELNPACDVRQAPAITVKYSAAF